MTFDAASVTEQCARLPQDLPDLEWITDDVRVNRLSSDFSWFSPILRRELAGKRANIAVKPRSHEELSRVVSRCASTGIPLTIRGAGTGNYGQSTPLHGGVVVDMSALNQSLWFRDGIGRAQTGIRLADFDALARENGSELRWLPSTFRSATLGGLFGGGFGGAGSINYGPVAAIGNVLGARVMTVEPEPQVLELRGAEAMLLHHAYGTNGIVTELEIALAPAQAWLECVTTFDSFAAALSFADALARAPGLVKKEVCFLADPVPGYLQPLAEYLPRGCHAVLFLLSEASESGMLTLASEAGGTVTYRRTAEEVRATRKTLIEYCWNHTTLNALKCDKSLTYIQSSFDPSEYVQQATALQEKLSDEVFMHLEFLRNAAGALTCSGLQIVRYSTEERLNEIMQIHRDHGVRINNPHAFVVEDGKQGQVNAAAVRMKERLDPMGLLNPGKLRGWDQRTVLA